MVTKQAVLRQLDRKLRQFNQLRRLTAARPSWIRAVRTVLGMSQADLARRIGVSQPTVDGFERAEAEGKISLATLRRAGHAMDCDLVYALVPRHGLQRLVERQARSVAARIATGTNRSMRLEDQGVAATETRAQIRDLARELAYRRPRGFWRDDR